MKLDRAKEHLQTFDEESGDWLEKAQFCRFIPENDGDERVYILHIRDSPPMRLAAVIGDCVHNIRASLDYLAWELVRANHGTPGDKTYFPIYRYWKVGTNFSPKAVNGMSPDMVAEIERLQPYYGGQNPDVSILWFLSQLSNTDKHRTINIVVGAVQVKDFRVTWAFPDGIRMLPPTRIEIGILHHGTKVASYPLADVQDASPMKEEAQINGLVTLDQRFPWGKWPISRHVGEALFFVRDQVLPRFDRFFPHGPSF